MLIIRGWVFNLAGKDYRGRVQVCSLDACSFHTPPIRLTGLQALYSLWELYGSLVKGWENMRTEGANRRSGQMGRSVMDSWIG